MVFAILRQALDRLYLPFVGLNGQNRATLDHLAVEPHDTGAALAGVTTHVGTGQTEILPEEVDEEKSRLYLGSIVDTVDRQADGYPRGGPSRLDHERSCSGGSPPCRYPSPRRDAGHPRCWCAANHTNP